MLCPLNELDGVCCSIKINIKSKQLIQQHCWEGEEGDYSCKGHHKPTHDMDL